jgi:hypothetical protein
MPESHSAEGCHPLGYSAVEVAVSRGAPDHQHRKDAPTSGEPGADARTEGEDWLAAESEIRQAASGRSES